MLARTFKSAAELNIPVHEYNALSTLLHMAESGEIKPSRIKMNSYHNWMLCTYCLAGWANQIDKSAFPEVNGHAPSDRLIHRLPKDLTRLFGINWPQQSHASPETAVAALRTYLETGHCK